MAVWPPATFRPRRPDRLWTGLVEARSVRLPRPASQSAMAGTTALWLADAAFAAEEEVLEARVVGDIPGHRRRDLEVGCQDAAPPSTKRRCASRSIIGSPVTSRSISGT